MLRLTRLAVLAVALPLTAGCASATSTDSVVSSEAADTALPNPGIQSFQMVRPGLYRGGHPDAAGLDYLKSLGRKTPSTSTVRTVKTAPVS
jgi:hypothetical protein